MPAGGLVVKRRLADAALMEMRLNEESNKMNTNQKKGIVNREIIPQTRLNMYPKRRFCGHIAGTCTRKGGFGYISDGRRGVAPRTALKMLPASGLPADGGRQVCTVRRPAGIVRYIL